MKPDGLNGQKTLEEEHKIMAAYGDTAKIYSQFSLGILMLSVIFLGKLKGIESALR